MDRASAIKSSSVQLARLPECRCAQLLACCELVATMSLPERLACSVAQYADAAGTCGPASAAPAAAGAQRLEEYDGGHIVDITHAYRPELPAVGPDGLGPVVFQTMSMANGSICNLSELRMVVHAGTHIDTPGHMIQEHFEAGLDADKLDLAVLNGSSNRAN